MIDAAILHYCNYQERCHQEVRNKLYEIGHGRAEVERQIVLLIENGMLNEERFAMAYARGKFRMKQWGRVKIKQELKLRGISEYCIKKGMKEIDEEEYGQVLDKLTKKKLYELRNESNALSKKGKLYRYLVQKGFEGDLVNDRVNDFLGE